LLPPVKEQLTNYILELQQPKKRTFKTLQVQPSKTIPFPSSAKLLITPDHSKIVSFHDGGQIKVWDMESGQCLHALDNELAIFTVAMSQDGSKVASGSSGIIKVWDIKNREHLYSLTTNGQTRSISFSSDDQKLLSLNESILKVWDTSSGECLHTIVHDSCCHAQFISKGTQMISVGGNDVKIWDVETGE
jgi:WD40 repeat protein